MNINKRSLKEGDILICRGKSWISRAIMKVTKGEWSHTALVASSWGSLGVIEAQRNGVNFKTWELWRKRWNYDYIVYRNILIDTDQDRKDLMKKAFSVVGETKYDYFTFFRRAFGNRKKRSEAKELKKFICSEFTAWIHSLKDWYDMTPSEQKDILDKNHLFIKIMS
jgi:hypothetical protein